jgi:hypothetical protein
MASNVQIAKLALQHIGDRYDISDLEEAGTEAEQINLVFDDTRKELLRSHPWTFANKYASPATLSVTVPGNWTYAYQYPTDAIRVIEIVDPLGGAAARSRYYYRERDIPVARQKIPYEVSLLTDDTKVILSNEQSAEFRYTANISDPTKFDPEFVNAFSLLLASKVAMALTGDGGIRDILRQGAQRAIYQAGATDANEGVTDEAPEASWIIARN